MRKRAPKPSIKRNYIYKRAAIWATEQLLVVLSPCCARRLRFFPQTYHHRRVKVHEYRFCPNCRRLWTVEIFRRGGRWNPVANLTY